jgi:hypothetical protein
MRNKRGIGWNVLSLAALASLAAAGGGARADLINVDFNSSSSPTYIGPGVLGAAGDFWNGVGGPSLGANLPLRNAAGTATGVKISYSGSGLFFFDAEGAGTVFTGTPFDALLRDYMVADKSGQGGPSTVTLSGLNSGGAYRLILFSIANSRGRDTSFTVGGVTQDVIAGPDQFLKEGENFADFMATADASGNLVITVAAGNAVEGDLDGIQLTPFTSPPSPVVPEPPTVALLALGGGALAGWRRWRRRTVAGRESVSVPVSQS